MLLFDNLASKVTERYFPWNARFKGKEHRLYFPMEGGSKSHVRKKI